MIKEVIYAFDGSIPKIELVGELIRCKDCRYIRYLGSGTMGDVICNKHDIQVSRYSYCSFGEKESDG